MHLIDTSVWVDFLRGTSSSKVDLLEALLEEGEAYLCEVTYSEICFGARDQRQFERYRHHFSSLPFLALPPSWHLRAAEMGNHLRLKGRRPFLADLLIALTALHHQAILLTEDRDFQPFREFFGLAIE